MNESAETVQFFKGDEVSVFSAAGPCLTAKVVKVNRVKVKLDFYGSTINEYKSLVHKPGSCSSCRSYPQTQYPNGYMD